jgi:glyoxylase-like metal-dependent hydrolase (beta-lactamase superfamily II)/8-oxo-dGTP pyrophosphatase MutT (NUDIX family)
MSSATGFYAAPADARLAASVLFLRDPLQDGSQDARGGLEVLMLRRAEREGDLRSGAAVFPGGVLDARDREAHALCLGADDADVSALLGVAPGGLDYLVAAVRESFEEVGLLLTDRALDAKLVHPWRERLQSGAVGIAEFCAAHDVRLDLSGLVYFSHWLTPPGQPKRFDTRFFAVRAPAGQIAVEDRGEAVELMWLTPAAALDRARGLKLLPVTRRTLQDLGRHRDVESALADAHGRRARIRLTMPRRAADRDGGLRVVLPDELPYAEVGRLDPEGRGDVLADIVPGRAVRLSPHIVRLTAPNPGPMTGPGTNTYLVGAGDAWTCIDPGPAIGEHVRAIEATLRALGPQARLEQILVTHTHGDHSPGAVPLAAATGAPVFGRRAAHPEWQDKSFAPARELADGERLVLGTVPGSSVTLRVIHTPGHASNHLCYLLEEEKTLFTGDHVMQGSTVVINPPDGDMGAYLRALEGLLGVELDWLAPGHGFLVADPHGVLRALIAHRLKREDKVIAALRERPAPVTVKDLIPRVYDDVPSALHGLAERSLLAHLIKLEEDRRATRADNLWRWSGG